MTSSEPGHALYSELERVIGPENAKTLMIHLPMHSGDDVATKADIARLEARLDRLEFGLDQMQRTYITTVVGSMTALTGIFSLIVVFLG